MDNLEIAIIDSNTLTCIGLRNLLEKLLPKAIIRIFPDFAAFADDTPDMYSHYFISSQTYILYNPFFLPRKEKTIIMMHGAGNHTFPASNHIVNIFLPEKKLTSELMKFFSDNADKMEIPPSDNDLSAREIEVLILVTKGLINKEIADKLNISLTTVISHRKNITEKLGIKSVSGLTIYAVMNGYVSPDRI
ncbi:helix-turn-helix transcriptional regulator [uncultured Bacteroides sp.]|jgi:DNA-binding CsgD family transcriptional regulator|uniref:response regulator transcription factor n=1 Tax=uncultured Bacteroides sp. TaxID=162156 RepID=UPI002AA62B66|nr:helix-turn-helix transcriptional regulator [uncultured Bacteroides sp.]